MFEHSYSVKIHSGRIGTLNIVKWSFKVTASNIRTDIAGKVQTVVTRIVENLQRTVTLEAVTDLPNLKGIAETLVTPHELTLLENKSLLLELITYACITMYGQCVPSDNCTVQIEFTDGCVIENTQKIYGARVLSALQSKDSNIAMWTCCQLMGMPQDYATEMLTK